MKERAGKDLYTNLLKTFKIINKNINSPYSEGTQNHNSHGNVEKHNAKCVNHSKVLLCYTKADKALYKPLLNNHSIHQSETRKGQYTVTVTSRSQI